MCSPVSSERERSPRTWTSCREMHTLCAGYLENPWVTEANRTQELRVAVQMTLETAAHERYGLVSGSATVSGCRVVNHTECRMTQIPLGG